MKKLTLDELFPPNHLEKLALRSGWQAVCIFLVYLGKLSKLEREREKGREGGVDGLDLLYMSIDDRGTFFGCTHMMTPIHLVLMQESCVGWSEA